MVIHSYTGNLGQPVLNKTLLKQNYAKSNQIKKNKMEDVKWEITRVLWAGHRYCM